jgi:hypothetical protein
MIFAIESGLTVLAMEKRMHISFCKFDPALNSRNYGI